VAYVETDRRTVHQCLNGRAPHNRIYRSTASRSPVLTRAGICVPPTVTYLPYSVSGSTLTAVGRSQLLARWPGTHSRILSGIRRAAQTVLGVYLKRTCSRVTSASSALGVLNDLVLYKSWQALTNPLTSRRQDHRRMPHPSTHTHTHTRTNQWLRVPAPGGVSHRIFSVRQFCAPHPLPLASGVTNGGKSGSWLSAPPR